MGAKAVRAAAGYGNASPVAEKSANRRKRRDAKLWGLRSALRVSWWEPEWRGGNDPRDFADWQETTGAATTMPARPPDTLHPNYAKKGSVFL